MVLEAAGGLAGGEVPQAERLVPRAGEGEVAVRGEDDVRDKVPVPVQPLLRDAVLGLVPGRRRRANEQGKLENLSLDILWSFFIVPPRLINISTLKDSSPNME